MLLHNGIIIVRINNLDRGRIGSSWNRFHHAVQVHCRSGVRCDVDLQHIDQQA